MKCPHCKSEKTEETIHGHGHGLHPEFTIPENTIPFGFGGSSYRCLDCKKGFDYETQFWLTCDGKTFINESKQNGTISAFDKYVRCKGKYLK